MAEIEAACGRTEALYLAVTEEERAAKEEGASLTVLKTKLEREMFQLGAKSESDGEIMLFALTCHGAKV